MTLGPRTVIWTRASPRRAGRPVIRVILSSFPIITTQSRLFLTPPPPKLWYPATPMSPGGLGPGPPMPAPGPPLLRVLIGDPGTGVRVLIRGPGARAAADLGAVPRPCGARGSRAWRSAMLAALSKFGSYQRKLCSIGFDSVLSVPLIASIEFLSDTKL